MGTVRSSLSVIKAQLTEVSAIIEKGLPLGQELRHALSVRVTELRKFLGNIQQEDASPDLLKRSYLGARLALKVSYTYLHGSRAAATTTALRNVSALCDEWKKCEDRYRSTAVNK